MGIFDIFSNSDAQNAAQAQITGYQNAYNALQNNIATANQTAGQQYAGGQGALNTGAQNAGGALSGNFGNAQSQLAGAYGQGANALNQNYAAALQPFQQNYNAGAAGQTQLGNLLGLNGPNGSAQAQQTLQNMPGYQFALNQGNQNVMRNQAATGQLNSGATSADLQALGQGLASQNYNSYVSQLQPYLGASNNAASGIAGVNTGLGSQLSGLYQGLGQGQAGVSTGLGTNLANNYNNLGQNLNANMTGLGNLYNQNYNTQGQAAYGTLAGQGNAQAQADYANLAQSGALFGGLTSLLGGAAGSKAGQSAMGGLGTGVGSFFGGLFGCDERVKENFKLEGKSYGVNIWSYNYKGGKRRYYGVKAQELKKVMPDAVVNVPGKDFLTVKTKVLSELLRAYGNGRSLG